MVSALGWVVDRRKQTTDSLKSLTVLGQEDWLRQDPGTGYTR